MTEADYYSTRNAWITNYAIDYLEKRLSNIETIVQGITEKLDINLSNLKNQIEILQKTFTQPELLEVSRFVRDVSAVMKKGKEKQDKYVT